MLPWLSGSLVDRYLETGSEGHLTVLVFLLASAYAVTIHTRQLDLRHRLAFVPVALMPLILGILFWSQSATRTLFKIRHFDEILQSSDVGSPQLSLADNIGILPLAALLTVLLLASSCFLFSAKRSPSDLPTGVKRPLNHR